MCTGCVEDMQIVLRNTEGINDANVSFSDGSIVVKFDPEVIDARKVFLKVNSLGFRSRVIEEAE